jgi:hypothetical protein
MPRLHEAVSSGGQMEIRKRRKALTVSLNELATVLGPGFSPARLSLVERGLAQASEAEKAVILTAIDKLGSLRFEAKSIAESALNLDFTSACEDIRQQAQAIHASA